MARGCPEKTKRKEFFKGSEREEGKLGFLVGKNSRRKGSFCFGHGLSKKKLGEKENRKGRKGVLIVVLVFFVISLFSTLA